MAIVRDLRPRVPIPMHGLASAKRAFERLAKVGTSDTEVIIPRRRIPLVVDL